MKNFDTYNDIPPTGLDTPNGYLYYPPPQIKQVLFLITAFVFAILLGLLISSIPGDLSELASGVICFVFLLIFFLGYGLWIGFVSALAFESIKRPLIKIIYKIFIRREKPSSINEFLPEREKLIEMMIRVQKYSKLFLIVSWLVGILGGFATLLMKTSLSSSFLFLIVLISSVIYGSVLSYFGRRGYLPLPEE